MRAEYWFYQQYNRKNEQIKKKSGTVIIDRGLIGLFAYSNLLGGNREVSSRIMLTAMNKFWVPGLYIFLIARPEVIKQRLLSRRDSATIKEEDWDNGISIFIHILQESVIEIAKTGGIKLQRK